MFGRLWAWDTRSCFTCMLLPSYRFSMVCFEVSGKSDNYVSGRLIVLVAQIAFGISLPFLLAPYLDFWHTVFAFTTYVFLICMFPEKYLNRVYFGLVPALSSTAFLSTVAVAMVVAYVLAVQFYILPYSYEFRMAFNGVYLAPILCIMFVVWRRFDRAERQARKS